MDAAMTDLEDAEVSLTSTRREYAAFPDASW